MKYKFMDPDMIMNVIVALIVLAVGIFAFFVTVSNVPTVVPAHGSTDLQNATYWAILNASQTGNAVFNIVGVVLIIGAIMTIVGLVYSYIGPRRY